MKQVELTRGKFALVDDEDFEYLNQCKWYYSQGYAVRKVRKKPVLMHRVINETPKDKMTDHINGNGLDNRRNNLRDVNLTQNTQNQKIRNNGTSKYKGVHWCKNGKCYVVQIQANKKRTVIGQIKTENEAGKIYNELAIKLHGEYARLNEVI